MGNPFSKAIDPAEEEKKEQERMRKARESMFVNKNPIMQQPSIPKTEEKQRPTSQVNTNQNINSQTSKTQDFTRNISYIWTSYTNHWASTIHFHARYATFPVSRLGRPPISSHPPAL